MKYIARRQLRRGYTDRFEPGDEVPADFFSQAQREQLVANGGLLEFDPAVEKKRGREMPVTPEQLSPKENELPTGREEDRDKELMREAGRPEEEEAPKRRKKKEQ